jgi:peptidoglycan/LPS O-acetylase OafA/YrhL
MSATATPHAGLEHAPDALAPPPGNPRFPALDALRGIAALLILLFHVGQTSGANAVSYYGGITSRFTVGVPLFFVLSGFLLYRPFVAARLEGRPRPRLRSYARRRALRIIPGYWVALTAVALVLGADQMFEHWWVFYGFLQSYSIQWVGGGIGQAWSLDIELVFYAFLPLYALGVARLTRGWARDRAVRAELLAIGGLGLASLISRTLLVHSGHFIVYPLTLPGTYCWFCGGMGLAVVSAVLGPSGRGHRIADAIADRPGLCWVAALVLLVGGGLWLPRTFHTYSEVQYAGELVIYGAIALLLVLPAVLGRDEGGWPRRLLASAPLAWLGLVSYGIYLYHAAPIGKLSIHGATTWLPFGSFLNLLVLSLPIAIACAAGSYYVVERPFLALKEPRRPSA